MTTIRTSTVGVAAHGLAGSRIDPPAGPLDEPGWFDLIQACRAGQLVGFLAAAVARHDLAITEGQAEELSVLESEVAGLSLLVEQRVMTACAVLAAAGIDNRVIDGPACHRLAYAGSSMRTYEAAAVLVPADRIVDAHRLPGLAGRRERRDGVEGRAAPARRSDVGLRANVVPDSWTRAGTVGIEQLGPGAPFEVAGRRIVGVSVDEQLVVACLDLAVDRFSPEWLLRVRDVAELALSPRLDPGEARRLAERWQAAEVMAEMLAMVWQVFDLADKTELSVWALRVDGTRTSGNQRLAGGTGRRRRPARAAVGAGNPAARRLPATAEAPVQAPRAVASRSYR